MNTPPVFPIRTAFLGFAIADALGVPFEFNSRKEMDRSPATGMTGFGTHMQPPGTWSDDTSMSLCVLENLIEGGDAASLSEKFVRWYRDEAYTANGQLFDIGITTSNALDAIIANGYPSPVESYDSTNAGNGSLMRAFPYAFLPDQTEAMVALVRDGRVTHPSSICTECCLFFVRFLQALLEGRDKSGAWSDAVIYLTDRPGFDAFDHGPAAGKEVLSRLLSGSFKSLPREEIESSGYVVHTLEAAIWCLFQSDSYTDAVLMAVNLGEDTDTVAAVTGVLAAVYFGERMIPEGWLNALAGREELERILIRWPNS